MKRILVNATHAEEIRVALCKGNHLYDFDLENRTREQKKANIYKGHITRVEPSLEAVFVEYGSERQGFLSVREISREYLKGDPRSTKNIRELISEGDELLVQVSKEERGNKGAALTTFISLAGRYLVLMPNNSSGGGISRQISGQTRDEMKRMLSKLRISQGMSVIIRTAGIGRTQEDLQNDLDHLLSIWQNINHVAQNQKSPCLAHQEAGVVTRAVRDYLRDDIAEVWIDNEQAYNEAYNFVSAVMPHQVQKLRKYLDIEPMFARFGVENQIETAYLREVKLPSGGSIVIDQTEALVSIDINSAKATKGADVESTAHNTNLEAADEIARQLRLRDMGGLVVIDFIDMMEDKHQRSVEQRLRDATQPDRARLQFTQISRFGLLEMSRQRLRPSLEEATGYKCPRCNGTGMIRDLGSLALSIIRNIEEIALREGRGEVQAEVPIEVAAFLLNEKRDSLVYLEQDSGARITILPHAHLETPNYKIHFNRDGYAPTSYDRISDKHAQETAGLGYETSWQTDRPTPEKQAQKAKQNKGRKGQSNTNNTQQTGQNRKQNKARQTNNAQATAWLSNLFQPAQQAHTSDHVSAQDAATAIEEYVNDGSVSLGASGSLNQKAVQQTTGSRGETAHSDRKSDGKNKRRKMRDDKRKRKPNKQQSEDVSTETNSELPRRDAGSRRPSRGPRNRNVDLDTVATSQENAASSPKEKAKKAENKPLNPNEVNVNIAKTDTADLTEAQVVNIDLDNDTVTKTPLEKKTRRRSGRGKQNRTQQTSEASSTPELLAASSTQAQEPTESVNKTTTTTTEPAVSTTATTSVVENNITASTALPLTRWEGRAKNDPRDISKANGQSIAVSGSVLSFTQKVLGEAAESQIAEQGLVTSFINALNSATQSNASSISLEPTPLSEEHINAYRNSISYTAQASANAGTADVEMPAAGYRASNDPRGRIAGFDDVPAQFLLAAQSVVVIETETTTNDSADVDKTQASEISEQGTSLNAHEAEAVTSSDAQAELVVEESVNTADLADKKADNEAPVLSETASVNFVGLSLGEFIKQQLGMSAQKMLEDGQIEAAFLKALTQPSVQSTDETAESASKKPKKKPAKKPSKPATAKTKRTSRKAASAEISRPAQKAADSSAETVSADAPKPKRRGRPPKKKADDISQPENQVNDTPESE